MTPSAGFAAAKINLTLHVVGQRDDGYHLLDSLVAFADIGDRVSADPADELTLRIVGPESDGLLADQGNLVLRAASAFDRPLGATITLEKNLPVASGIGGGSADAAAALRVLSQTWRCLIPPPDRIVGLGSDVPVCLGSKTCRMGGIGADLVPSPKLPAVWAVLANPRHALATPEVFAALVRRDMPPMPVVLPMWKTAEELALWLRMMRNDLEPAAIRCLPVVSDLLAALSGLPGCLFARMSGSGATCFGLFGDPLHATAAATQLGEQKPGWWVRAAMLGRYD